MRPVIALLALFLVSTPVCAHHSPSEYDRNELLEIEGEVVSVLWRNPHVMFEVRVTSVDRLNEMVEFESSPALTLERRGVSRDAVAVGDYVTIAGFQSTRRDNRIQLRQLWKGGKILIGGEAEGGTFPSAKVAVARASADGIFRVWSTTAGRFGKVRWQKDLPLRAEARERQLKWDPFADDPARRCVPPGMPRAMSHNPRAVEFVDEGKVILIRLEEFDAQRTIHMDGSIPNNVPPVPLGYSVGHWEDGTLIIETTHIDYPLFDREGVPQSSEVTIVEKFSLSDNEEELAYEITVTDSETFTEPVTGSKG